MTYKTLSTYITYNKVNINNIEYYLEDNIKSIKKLY
jgi:hypothetical protein